MKKRISGGSAINMPGGDTVLSRNLRIIRERVGLTQTEFGKILEASKTMIQSYESGKAAPKSIILSKICALASLKIDHIYDVIDYSDLKIPDRLIDALIILADLNEIQSKIYSLSGGNEFIENTNKHSIVISETSDNANKEVELQLSNYRKNWESKFVQLSNIVGGSDHLSGLPTFFELIEIFYQANPVRRTKLNSRDKDLLILQDSEESLSPIFTTPTKKIISAIEYVIEAQALYLQLIDLRNRTGSHENEDDNPEIKSLKGKVNDIVFKLHDLTGWITKSIDDLSIGKIIDHLSDDAPKPFDYYKIEDLRIQFKEMVEEQTREKAEYVEEIYRLKKELSEAKKARPNSQMEII